MARLGCFVALAMSGLALICTASPLVSPVRETFAYSGADHLPRCKHEHQGIVPSDRCKVVPHPHRLSIDVECDVAACERAGGWCGLYRPGSPYEHCEWMGVGWPHDACNSCDCAWK